ncbi:MAG: hypothetical protein P1V33_03425 [Pseudohongiella nitratireducens]|nr:hypothetical protein [Pseudohongiella nitratireducens]MDF1622505.1 hypothetical protein [Pseudohongiella nitratireducens]
MDAERIRKRLSDKGYNYARIAKLLNLSAPYVSLVARRSRQNHRVALAIATAIEKPVDHVFPDVPVYHGPLKTDEQRDKELAELLAEKGVIRRSA